MGRKFVAVVGRPNVGKSTLFNKLAGKRIAIVDDKPGVTRDRIYAKADWLQHEFTLIDTGGIEPKADDIILAQMRRQALIAIETCDVIMFVVDGKLGMTDADNEVALMLRKSGKPVVLVVNKLEKKSEEANLYEFYNLGLGTPMPISATQALGLGDMLDEVVAHFGDVSGEEEEDDNIVRVAFMGKPNVGKSSLINRLIGEERNIVSTIPGTTRDAVDSYLETEEGQFMLIDTAGIRRKSKIKEVIERYSVIRSFAAIEKADVCVLMIDATEGVTDQDEKIIGFAHDQSKALMVIVNKWDLIEKDNKTFENFKKDIQQDLKFAPYVKFLFISALTGQRSNKVMKVVKECYESYNKRVSTGVLNEIVSQAVLMNEPPIVSNNRLKIYYATQVASKPPTFVFFVNNPDLLHFSYKRYLENQLRNAFGFEGTGIKLIFRERKDK